jgi:hypothetical protein
MSRAYAFRDSQVLAEHAAVAVTAAVTVQPAGLPSGVLVHAVLLQQLWHCGSQCT